MAHDMTGHKYKATFANGETATRDTRKSGRVYTHAWRYSVRDAGHASRFGFSASEALARSTMAKESAWVAKRGLEMGSEVVAVEVVDKPLRLHTLEALLGKVFNPSHE